MKTLLPHLSMIALLATPVMADDAQNAKLMETGKPLFATCSACHGPDGTGLPVGAMKMAPSFAGSKVVNGDPAIMALVVLKGIQKEGTEFVGMMAPLEGMFADDEKLAAILTYVRGSFGNTAAAVTPEDAKKFREQWKDIKAPVTRAKIAELSAEKK